MMISASLTADLITPDFAPKLGGSIWPYPQGFPNSFAPLDAGLQVRDHPSR
jgi:hypothetical protein